MTGSLSPALSELDELVDHLEGVRARAANAFAAETHFFANVARLVERRERERAARADDGSTVHGTQLGMREVYAEIAAALRLSEYQVASRVSAASNLTTFFHETLCDVSDGRISPQHAQAIAEIGIQIEDPAVRAEYERHARDIALDLTAAQLRDALDGLVSRLDPDGTKQRIRHAVAERGVRLRHMCPGLSRVSIDLPTAEAVGAMNRLSAMADEILAENEAIAAEAAATAAAASTPSLRAANPHDRATPAPHPTDERMDHPAGERTDHPTGEGTDHPTGEGTDHPTDARTKRQIEADIAADLLLTSAPEAHGVSEHTRSALAAIRPTVQITIPAGIIASAVKDAAELTGGTFSGRPAAGDETPRCANDLPDAVPTGTLTARTSTAILNADPSTGILNDVACAGDGVGEVVAHGPIDDVTARLLAGLADGWVRVFTDPQTGVPVNVDRYRPTARQRLYLEARDLHCRFPGCRRPAEKCDLDHTTAHAEGGPTALCNLACLCARHHTVKHHTDWKAAQLPGGVITWTSPTRRGYRTRPPGAVRFVAAPHPPDRHQTPTPF